MKQTIQKIIIIIKPLVITKNVSDNKSFSGSPIGVSSRIGRDSPTQRVTDGISGGGGAPPQSGGDEEEKNRRPIKSYGHDLVFSDRPCV